MTWLDWLAASSEQDCGIRAEAKAEDTYFWNETATGQDGMEGQEWSGPDFAPRVGSWPLVSGHPPPKAPSPSRLTSDAIF